MIHLIQDIQESVRAGRYRLSSHAEFEREADNILTLEIEEALLSQGCTVVEDYPDDPRGHSALVLGFSSEGPPLHILIGMGQSDIRAVGYNGCDYSLSSRPHGMGRLESKAWLNMHRCYFCKGLVKPERITHVHRWKEQVIILEDVPADVCQQCGELYFAPEVLKSMDQIAEHGQQEKLKKQLVVPVYSLSEL